MADNFKITIGIQADPNDIKNIQSQLQALGGKAKPIVLNMDTDTVKAELVSVEKSAAKTGANIAKNINQGLVKIDPKITTGNIKKINKALDGIGFSNSAKSKVTKDLKGLEIEVTKAVSKIDKEGKVNLEVKGIAKAEDGLERVITVMQRFDKEGNKIGKGSYTSVAVDFEKQANDAYKKAKAMVDKINSLKVKKANMTSSASSSEMKQLQSEIDKTEKELAELRNEWKKPWGKAKNADLTTGLKAAEREVKNIKKALGDDLKLKIDTGYLKKEFDSVETKANKLDSISPELKKIIEQCKSAKTRMENLLNDGDIDGAARAFDRFKNNIQAANNQLQMGSNAQKAANASLKVLEKSYSNIAKLEKNIANLKLDPKANASQINVLEKQLEEARAEYNRLENALKGDLSDAQFKELSASANRLENELEQTNAKIADTKTKLASSIKIKMADGTFSNDLSRVETQFGKLSNQTVGLKKGIKQLRIEMASMSANANDNDELINNYERYKRVLKSVENELKEVARAEQENIASQKLSQDRSIFQQKIDAWMTDNSRAAKEFGGAMLDLKAKAESCDRVTLNRLEKEFKQIDMAAETAGKKGLSFADKMKSQFEKYGAYLSVASAAMYATMALKDMARQVVAIDTAMTELKKVTNETDAAYDDFLSSAATGAKEIGTTIDGLVQSAAGFARLGYSFADSQELAKVANTYAVVGDEVEGVEGATKSLISTMAAFKDDFATVDSGDFATSIIDKFNEVGNNFAISSGGIGEALQRSASSLAAANNTIDESIAMITAANTVVQDPARIGNAFKTISMRIRGAKTELEEAGESTDGMVESTAKLQQEIKALSGVDIMIDKDTFKSTYQVMDELSAKWENLSDIAQASIIELMAGKHQGNVFASLMTNWETARDVLETSQNSEGSAMAEHAKWAESLEAKILKLKAAWQGFSQAVMNSDFLRGLLDTATKALDVVTLLVDKIGVVPTLLAGFAVFKSVGGNGLFRVKELEDGTKEFTNIFKEAKEKSLTLGIKTDDSFRESLTKDTHALFRFRDAVKSGMSPLDASNNLMAEASTKAKDYALSKDFATKGITGFIKEQKTSRVAAIAEGKSLASMRILIDEYNTGLKNSSKICKATGMTQRELTNAIGETNGGFAKYLSGLKGAEASMGGYIKHLASGAAKTLVFEAATMALNAALTMGIGFAISVAMSAILKWMNAEEELAEKVEEVTTKYREQHKALTQGKSSFESEAARYVELRKGVGELGQNLSLTTAEYEEYQSIVNSIANQIPTLVAGYDSQGNAILNCAGNVNELVDAYNKLIKAQNDSVISNAGDIEQNFSNFIDDFEDNDAYGNMTNKTIKHLEKMLNSDMSQKDVSDYINKTFNTIGSGATDTETPRNEILKALKDAGIKEEDLGLDNLHWFSSTEKVDEFIAKAMEHHPDVVKSIVNDFNNQFEEEAKKVKPIADAVISNAFDVGKTEYSGMTDNMQNIVRQVVNSFDAETYENLVNSGTSVKSYVTDILDSFKSLEKSGDSKKLEAVFDLQTNFNDGKVSYGEYVNGVKDAVDVIDSLDVDDDVKKQLKLTLNTEEITSEYKSLKSRLTSKDYDIQLKGKDAENFLNDLSAEEYAVAVDIIPELSNNKVNETVDDLRAAIKREIAIRGLNVDLDINAEKTGIDNLNIALQESISATGLSEASINNLKSRYAELESEGYNLSAMFEETTNGVHLNKKAVAELEQAYAKGKLDEVKADLDTLKGEYDLVSKEIDECTRSSERAALYTQRDAILQQINDTATLATQYEGLASAYKAWQDIEGAGSERDMYEGIISGFETVEDEISRGWFDDGTIKFLELLTGKTGLATKKTSELKKIYDSLDDTIKHTAYSVNDFFTVDDDGNSTNAGVYNFLDAVGQLEEEAFKGLDVVKRDKSGNIISFDFGLVAEKDEHGNIIKNGDQVIAEALGISEELVQIMLRAADDAGFVVNLEGAYTQLADLKTEAEAARDSLISLKKQGKLKDVSGKSIDTDVKFNFEAEGNDLVKEQEKAIKLLDKFKKDGKVDLSIEGAQDALDIAEYLTIKLDDLTEPKFMQIDTSEVDEDLRDPIEKIQEIGDLCKQKHLVTLEGDTKEIDEVQDKIDEAAKEIEEYSPEVKAQIGVDENWSAKEIADHIEKGDIEIPAELELDVQMSDDLKDMRLMMMNQLGLISDEEVKLKIGYDIDESLVDSLTEEEQEVAVNFVVKNEEEFNKLTEEEKEVVVDLVTDGDAMKAFEEHQIEIEAFAKIFGVEEVDDLKEKLDTLDDEQIQILATVLGQIDVEELKKQVDGLSNKEIKAIAKAIGEGDVDGLKTAINNLNPKTVEAIAKALGYKDVDELNTAIDGMDGKTVQAIAQALGITDVDSLKDAIDRLDPKTVEAIANVSGKSDVDGLRGAIDALKGKSVTVWASIRKKASSLWGKLTGGSNEEGGSGADGTAHVNGTTGRAFNRGNWATKNSGTALVGELGTETLVRNGRYYTIGDNGAEFIKYQRGDIIFNHRQTEELFKNGKVTSGGGRGKAFAEGTAFDGGSNGSGGGIGKVTGGSNAKDNAKSSSSSKSKSKSNSNSKSSKDAEEFKETIDWIEVAIARIERAIDRLDTRASRTWKSWSYRNNNLTEEISKIRDEIDLQERAYNRYIQEANSVGLSEFYKKKVREGKIDIETIKNEDLKEKIDLYKQW